MSQAAIIKAQDIAKLRQATGAGFMDCKKALADASGDMDKALKLLRERGIAKSSKRADRVAGEGKVAYWISDDKKQGVMLELNCETDFAARNDEFAALVNDLLEQIKKNPSWTKVDEVPQEPIKALSGKTGEKMQLKRFTRFSLKQGLVSGYIHAGSKLGVLIAIESDKDVASNKAVDELAKELALQIAGANPLYVASSDVPVDVIEREKEIAKKQMEGQKKPPEILEKIATGKLSQFYAQNCLLDQPHVRDAGGKTKVKQIIEQTAKKEGLKLSVKQFNRFLVGAD